VKTKAKGQPPKKRPPKKQPAKKNPAKHLQDDRALYLYAISRSMRGAAPLIAAEGIDGDAVVESLVCEGHLCWVSRVPRTGFADDLPSRMEDLEWLATAGLRHQRTVAAIAEKMPLLPTRFGTVFLGENSLGRHLRDRKGALGQAFKRVAGADEWGVKVFGLPQQQSKVTATPAASGSDYLKRKAAQLKPRMKPMDETLRKFIAELSKLAVATSPGGKASAGQPGLEWHGSFLVRRKDRNKLEKLLAKYAEQWRQTRRIDCSGPWPPYSFVGDHVR
jgi:hypothetical protein